MKLAAARGKNDIAGERDIAAGAGGDAVHRGNNRKGQGAQLADQRIVVRLQRAAEHDRFSRFGKPVARDPDPCRSRGPRR